MLGRDWIWLVQQRFTPTALIGMLGVAVFLLGPRAHDAVPHGGDRGRGYVDCFDRSERGGGILYLAAGRLARAMPRGGSSGLEGLPQ